jgi:hypothetical protein
MNMPEVVYFRDLVEKRDNRYFVREEKIQELKSRTPENLIWYLIRETTYRGASNEKDVYGQIILGEHPEAIMIEVSWFIRITTRNKEALREIELYDYPNKEKINKLMDTWVMREENGEWKINTDIVLDIGFI